MPRTVCFTLLIFTMVLPFSSVDAQQTAEAKAAKKKFDDAVDVGRELAKECRLISARFYDSTLAESYQWKEKWPAATKALSDHRMIIEQSAIDWFFLNNNPDESLLQLIGSAARNVYEAGDSELAYRILKRIEEHLPGKEILLERQLALIGIKCNEFDRAVAFAQTREGRESIEELESQLDKNMFILSSILSRNWEQEKQIRQKEKEADDLPRVKLKFSTGEVILELFENEAPETVANFISLVESGYYDNSYCHPVIDQIVAQAGLLNKELGVVPVGYVIKNESQLPNSRRHFAGSVSMVSQGATDSASTLFAVTLLPNPDLDWNGKDDDKISQTVFGRVVSGMKYVGGLPATLEIDEETQKEKPIKGVEPAYIESATVIRKRDHEYKFEKLKKPETKAKDPDKPQSASQ